MRGEKKIFTDINRGGRLKAIEKRVENGLFWGEKKKKHPLDVNWLAALSSSSWICLTSRAMCCSRSVFCCSSLCTRASASVRALTSTDSCSWRTWTWTQRHTHSIKKHLHTKGDSSSLLFIVPRLDTCFFRDLNSQPYRHPASLLTHRPAIVDSCSWVSLLTVSYLDHAVLVVVAKALTSSFRVINI